MSGAATLAARRIRQVRGGRCVLDDVSIAVATGEVVALVGESGAGKTSLLRCLVGLDELDGGAIELDGVDVLELGAVQLRRRVGLVLGPPAMLEGTVGDNLAYGMPSLPSADASGALERCALDASFLEREADALSTGQRARVAIARALVRRPRVLLLDEPTAALDARSGARIETLATELAAAGLAVLIVTHDLAQADRIAGRRVTLSHGRTVE